LAVTNDAVVENLKAIKVLHQLLMAVTAAVFVFVLRPDLTQEYKDSLDELAALKQVSWGGWSNYVAHRYQDELDRDNKFLRSWIREAGLRVKKGAQGPIIPVFGDQVPYPGTGKLLDLDTFFSKVQRIGVMKISASERQPFLDQITKWKAGRNPNVTITMLNLSVNSGLQYPDGTLMLDWLNRSPTAMSGFPLYLNTDEQPSQPGYVIITYSIQSETGSFALDWLRKDTFGQKIVDAKTGNIFPRLKTFWHQVNQDAPDQAIVFLQEEMAANARGTLSFFGIPVERSHAVLAGPVAMFCILLFMGLHLMHFRSLSPSNDAIRSYPWVALFHSWPAARIADASILLLPVLADGALLYKFGQTAEWSTRAGAIATFLAFLEGVGVLAEVAKVRKRSRLLGD
jgi:hypothetical protein